MKMPKKLLIWTMALLAFFVAACSDSTSPKEIELPTLLAEDVDLGDFTVDSLDVAGHKIFATPSKKASDSFVLGSLASMLESSGGTKVFLAANDDLEDPEIDWDNELFEGSTVSVKDTNRVSLVVMNDNNEIVAVWVVELPETKKENAQSSGSNVPPSSSSEKEESLSSCSEEKEKFSSSSIGTAIESSAFEDNSSSSEENVQESSSSIEEPSSSEEQIEESSSSVLSSEKNLLRMQAQVDGVTRNDLVIDSDKRTVSLALQSIMDTNKVQISNMKVSTNASYSGIALKSNLKLSKVEGNYEYPFTITAEDGSFAEWRMVLTVPPGVLLSELKFIYDDNEYDFDVIDSVSKIYVELDYGADLSKIELEPYGETFDLREGKTFALVDGNGELKNYMLKAGVQLPGSNFSHMDTDIWGTTGIALGTDGAANGTGNVLGTYSITSDPGFVQNDGSISLSSHVITCSWLGGVVGGGLSGGYKLGTGMYFTGSYLGVTATDLYQQGYVSGKTPSADVSNILPDMKLGADFSAKPLSFTVSYTYKHVGGKNSTYPQKSLIYVMLVGANDKVVAAGYITNDKDTQATVEIPLEYSSVEGILSAGFPVDSKLSKATEPEEIVSIHVMFAASAYAFNVAGGAIMGYESNYRGGIGAELIIDDFKLNY